MFHLQLAVLLLLIQGSQSLRMDMTMAMRKPLIAGNWKMNTDLNSAIALASELGRYSLSIITSYPQYS